MPSAADQIKYNRALKEAEEIQKRINDGVNIRLKTAEKLEQLQLLISQHEMKISMEKKAQAKAESERIQFAQTFENLSGSMLDNMSKLADKGASFSDLLEEAKENIEAGDDAIAGQANSFADMLTKINSGEAGPKEIFDAMAMTDFGPFEDSLKQVAGTLEKTPHLQTIFKVKAQTFAAIEKVAGGLLTTVRGIIAATGPIGILVAAAGFLAVKAIEMVAGLAKETFEIRQNLGTSMVESGRLAFNMKAAGFAAKMAGGNIEQGKEAVEGLLDAFRTTETVTMGTASATAKLLANTGLTGSEAGKLLKTMSLINGNSIETNVNTLLAKDNLAEAAGLRTANVLKQIAGDTDMFARAGEKGADALFRAAMAAEKMGVELSKFDTLADNLLDVEKTLDNQFRLSAMLGQNVDLSKSMQLAQAKDFEGLQAETRRLVRQIGVGNIQSMGRAQQNLLEETLGFELGDLMKLGQGETIGAGGTPPVAKDTLSAANKSNELSVEHHKEQMGALKKLQDQNVEIIKATKEMGS